MKYTVFFGHQIYAQYENMSAMRKDLYPHTDVQVAVYNGGHVYDSASQEWYRPDMTPVLIEDVPAELRMLHLILNL